MPDMRKIEKDYKETVRKIAVIKLEKKLEIEKLQEKEKVWEQLTKLNKRFHNKITPLQLRMITCQQYN